MMSSEDENTVATQILKWLSKTPYACSPLSPLATRPGNFVYRGFLIHALPVEDGTTARSIIIKLSTSPVAADLPDDLFEDSLLKSIADSSPLSTGATVVKVPRLYQFDRETNTQILEDFVETVAFRTLWTSPDADALSNPDLVTIGRHLGAWLRSFHTWTSAPNQASLRAQVWQHDPIRKTKYLFTFDAFLKVLGDYPDLLDGHQQVLQGVRNAAAKEFEKPSTEDDQGWGIIHGDFWSGNILIPSAPWREQSLSDGSIKLFIIDWEFAQFGHRSYDLGQIVGDLYEKHVFLGIDGVMPIMKGVIEGYGELTDEMAFRTALYVGVHLIGWYKRRPKKGPRVVSPEVIVAGLTEGRDFIIKAWEKDQEFFMRTALAALFARR